MLDMGLRSAVLEPPGGNGGERFPDSHPPVKVFAARIAADSPPHQASHQVLAAATTAGITADAVNRIPRDSPATHFSRLTPGRRHDSLASPVFPTTALTTTNAQFTHT